MHALWFAASTVNWSVFHSDIFDFTRRYHNNSLDSPHDAPYIENDILNLNRSISLLVILHWHLPSTTQKLLEETDLTARWVSKPEMIWPVKNQTSFSHRRSVDGVNVISYLFQATSKIYLTARDVTDWKLKIQPQSPSSIVLTCMVDLQLQLFQIFLIDILLKNHFIEGSRQTNN
jgi:hypothetical protein